MLQSSSGRGFRYTPDQNDSGLLQPAVSCVTAATVADKTDMRRPR